ncbi:MAG: hypothetical protein V7756_03935 [Halopseudomonas sp.]|uniref:hypothetical protein n=1 Tax=Halopseudomonas sp. TaxID=2901191 RepID=UPI003001C74A
MPGFDRINSLHLMVGGFQAVLAYGLYEAADRAVWPATHAAAFIPLFMLMLFFPFGFYCASRALTVRRWLISFAVALLASAIGLYQGLTVSGLAVNGAVLGADWSPDHPGDYLMPALILGLALFLLVPALALYRRGVRMEYPQWMQALQQNAQLLMQAALVLGLFWAVLLSASALFDLIGLVFLQELIERSWFSIPLSVLVFSHGVSLAVRSHSVSDYLTAHAGRLCGWLYPLAVALSVGFVLSWLLQGVTTLLATGHAANLLLWFVTLNLLLLILSVQAADDTAPPRWVGWMMLAGALALLPMVAVAGYALGLRVEQYGLTPARIWAMFVNLVLAVMVMGYLLHALKSARGATSPWLRVTSACAAGVVVLGILLMLGGPLDPRRISVAGQMARLAEPELDNAGLVRFLARDGGRFGTAALLRLAKQTDDPGSAAAVRAALARDALERADDSPGEALLAIISSLPVFPAGVVAPSGLLETLAETPDLAGCVADPNAGNACLIWQLQLSDNGPMRYLLLSRNAAAYPHGMLWQGSVNGDWRQAGNIDLGGDCGAAGLDAATLFDAVVAGEIELVPKARKDLSINGRRITTVLWEQTDCD